MAQVREQQRALRHSAVIRRAAWLVFLHFIAATWGIHLVANYGERQWEFMFSYAAGFAIVLACAADAQIVGRPLLRIIQLVMFFTWPIAAPAYLVSRRRWWGLLWVFIFALTLGFCYVGAAIVADMVRTAAGG